ncbi:fibrinogen-like YCDxxxxGGGW domain-containing protein [Rothia dentocariosa]|uniref:fibrinogen-like YCDxxxxGGGW domain-containing protein n=1 Tax=Rothia dentocariosa TaxID=2047 RepID=UPI003A883DB6
MKFARKATTAVGLALTLGLSGLAPVGPVAYAAEDAVVHDGSSSDKAAASCYEAKQVNKDAKSGKYWLYTPSMSAPQQFYCDQETNGGGWVLIGRGRDGWTENYHGRGAASKLYTSPEGDDAMTPVQLPSTTVDELLNGQKPQDLEDGVRFRRALNTDGTEWQNITAHRDQTERWTWALRSNNIWSNIDVSADNPQYMQRDRTHFDKTEGHIQQNGTYSVLNFDEQREQGWKLGFSYSRDVRANGNRNESASNSYLYRPSGSNATPFAFTQVYLRPKLTQQNMGAQAIGDNGTAASNRRALPKSGSMPWKWRTSDKSGTGNVNEMNTYVQAITQVGDTVFTGGDFAYLESAAGAHVDQSYLAGFNVNTGELVQTFKPKFNGQIKSLEALPNNKLAVGGEFTEVNGEKVPGFAVLDPATGQLDRELNLQVENNVSGSALSVKTLQAQGDYLYLGGTFTHLKSSGTPNKVYSRNAARVKISTNQVDRTWTPRFNGTVNGMSASADNSEVFAAGYFTEMNDQRAFRVARILDSAKKVGTWEVTPSYLPDPQTREKRVWGFHFDVQDAGSSVWLGGTEHMISQYTKNEPMTRLSSSITRNGGDFQDLHLNGNNIYGACHCGDFLYQGSGTHDYAWRGSTVTDSIRLVAAFDKDSGKTLPEFAPTLKGKSGHGIWESFVDSNGVLWVGGDLNRSLGENGVQQESVGFVRYAPRDVTPPPAPSNLTVTQSGDNDQLNWSASGEAGARYHVLRNDRVIATVNGTSYRVKHTDNARYFVRAADANGNYSASTSVAVSGKKAEQPKQENPKQENPQPQPENPKQDDPKQEDPKQEQPKQEQPKQEDPKQDDPKQEQPKQEDPKQEDPKQEQPKQDNPKQEDPKQDEQPQPENPATDDQVQPADPNDDLKPNEPKQQENPKQEQPKQEDPKQDNPKQEQPKQEDPKQEQKPQGDQVLVDSGSSWVYRVGSDRAESEWKTRSWLGGAWSRGKAPLGAGSVNVETEVNTFFGTPMSIYARKDVTLTKEQAQQYLKLTTYADDGTVVYVNGKEVARKNMPQGRISANTPATQRPESQNAQLFSVDVPAEYLREGRNAIAVEVHANSHWSNNISFDMQVISTAQHQNPLPEVQNQEDNGQQHRPQVWYWYYPEYYGNYGNGDYYGRRNQRVAYNYDHRGFGYMGGFGYAHGFFGRAFYDYGFGW